MFEAFLRGLIWLCLIVAAFYIGLYVIEALGIAIPAIVITIAKIIIGLIAILVLYRILKPVAGNYLP